MKKAKKTMNKKNIQENDEKSLSPEMYKFQHMKDELGYGDYDIAELRTLCGCTKYIQIDPKANNNYLQVAFSRPFTKEELKTPENKAYSVRTFEYQPWVISSTKVDYIDSNGLRPIYRRHFVFVEKSTEFDELDRIIKENIHIKATLNDKENEIKELTKENLDLKNTISNLEFTNYLKELILEEYMTCFGIKQYYAFTLFIRRNWWKVKYEFTRFLERVQK